MPKGKPRFENVEDELKLLERYAPVYRTLEGQEDCDPSLAWLGRKLATWQVTTVYPVALQMGREDVPLEERERLAQLIYSYLVRRTLCKFTAKNLNKVFQSVAAEFLENGVSATSFKGYFAKNIGDSSRFPTDREVRHGILNENAYAISADGHSLGNGTRERTGAGRTDGTAPGPVGRTRHAAIVGRRLVV